jgi:hypothetical protein
MTLYSGPANPWLPFSGLFHVPQEQPDRRDIFWNMFEECQLIR